MIDAARVRRYLRDFDLRSLFVEELGWDHHTQRLEVQVDGESFTLAAIAHKRGMVVFLCSPAAGGRVPDYGARRKIERLVARSVHEHIIVFADREKTTQVWQWVKDEKPKPKACREHTYHVDQAGEALVQKLRAIAFGFEEEETLTIVHVAGRARAAFDVERVTKRFYDRFKAEHAAFLRFLRGIPDEEMQRWYASVMLNRLMFIYFVQKKGFLDGNPDYLRAKLGESKGRGGDLYYSGFLCPLFFEGFAKKEGERSAAINRLLGKVPYLNGGLFLRHQIEEAHGATIDIPDAAFEKLFDFFDGYQWHLDERPLRADNEINPDVLGYIFEKYINQKQMGAYYTKEDITEYIGKNTVIPFLFDAARQKCRIAFEGDGSVWRLLQGDPDRYFYPAVKTGVTSPLPAAIAAGLNDVSRRTDWNRPAPEPYALPTEIWREVVARRQRYEDVRAKLANGEIQSINDLITYNLDIRQFAQDVIENCDGPELLRAFYQSIEKVAVLDPTCGSGAFLFAALNILEPLYEACLDRMESFLADLERSGEAHHPSKYADFRRILQRVEQHPNRRYFILKSIIVNNLYGVDIMEEAVEICKLRLFLKLVAQVENVEHIEPLPDIDFNIRSGNTLVGFATYDEVKKAVLGDRQGKFDLDDDMKGIDEKALDVDRLFALFRQQQTEIGGEVTAADKQNLRTRLKALEDELNRYLAKEYGIPVSVKGTSTIYERWLSSHRPFHWFVEFHRIMQGGGFDVVVGNPPYLEFAKVSRQYKLLDNFAPFSTNLYSACAYRANEIKQNGGYTSFIVPVSLPSTDRMEPLRRLLATSHNTYHVSFSTRPDKLFDGAEQRLTIFVQAPSRNPTSFSGGYLKWSKAERPHLFGCVEYVRVNPLAQRRSIWPKVHGAVERSILTKMLSMPPLAESHILGQGLSLYYKNTGIRYFNTVTLRAPRCWINGESTSSSRETVLHVRPDYIHEVHALLLSTTFFLYYQAVSNCRDLNPSDILLAPAPDLSAASTALKKLSQAIEKDYVQKGKVLRMHNKLTGIVELESLTPARSKPLLNLIDCALAPCYGFTDEELDFIINYDVKYRMGRESQEGEE
ncbi:MAG: Eco57I restriction-modification methylase domain-containing protein [Chloroflexi bacterium]|nr:Eco57I restriction-modification methylase domain-containing protein [Chloroflexota bacterium]